VLSEIWRLVKDSEEPQVAQVTITVLDEPGNETSVSTDGSVTVPNNASLEAAVLLDDGGVHRLSTSSTQEAQLPHGCFIPFQAEVANAEAHYAWLSRSAKLVSHLLSTGSWDLISPACWGATYRYLSADSIVDTAAHDGRSLTMGNALVSLLPASVGSWVESALRRANLTGSGRVAVLLTNVSHSLASALPSYSQLAHSSVAMVAMTGRVAAVVSNYALTASASVISFSLSGIVFLTLLYYLLSQENIWLDNLLEIGILDGATRKLVQVSFNYAVRQVFEVNLQCTIYHGLWTYLLFSFAGVHMVFVASVLSAVSAVLPFSSLFTLLVPLPAAIELGIRMNALYSLGFFLAGLCGFALFFAHWFVLSYADWYFYEKINHPWILGVSIIAGMAKYGPQGALIGPLLVSMLVSAGKLLNVLLTGTKDAASSPTALSFGQETPRNDPEGDTLAASALSEPRTIMVSDEAEPAAQKRHVRFHDQNKGGSPLQVNT
jgi:predicted PurR-regulated permease PerM